MPCHIPRFNLPSVIGMVSDCPRSELYGYLVYFQITLLFLETRILSPFSSGEKIFKKMK